MEQLEERKTVALEQIQSHLEHQQITIDEIKFCLREIVSVLKHER